MKFLLVALFVVAVWAQTQTTQPTAILPIDQSKVGELEVFVFAQYNRREFSWVFSQKRG
jgi:hypothetical protein